jgi:Endonuclease/Exonuclease/phosphatase family
MRVGLANVRGLATKGAMLAQELTAQGVLVAGLTETWLQGTGTIPLEGYRMIGSGRRRAQSGRVSGGVALVYRDHLNVSAGHPLGEDMVHARLGDLDLFVVYMPDKNKAAATRAKQWKRLADILESHRNGRALVMGDMNVHPQDAPLWPLAQEHGFTITNGDEAYWQQWTFETANHRSVVDYVLVSEAMLGQWQPPRVHSGEDFVGSDHKLLTLDLDMPQAAGVAAVEAGPQRWRLRKLQDPVVRGRVRDQMDLWGRAWAHEQHAGRESRRLACNMLGTTMG